MSLITTDGMSIIDGLVNSEQMCITRLAEQAWQRDVLILTMVPGLAYGESQSNNLNPMADSSQDNPALRTVQFAGG